MECQRGGVKERKDETWHLYTPCTPGLGFRVWCVCVFVSINVRVVFLCVRACMRTCQVSCVCVLLHVCLHACMRMHVCAFIGVCAKLKQTVRCAPLVQ